MSDAKPVVLLYGNCQAQSIWYLLQQCPSLKRFEHRVFATYEYGETFEPIDAELMARTEVVFEQVYQGAISPHRTMLREMIPASARHTTFPPYDCVALFPFHGHDPRRAAEPPRYPSGRYSWPDTVAAKLAGSDLDDDALFARYMELSREMFPDVQRLLEIDGMRFAARDELSDIKMADWLMAHFRDEKLFNTVGHTSAAPILEVLQRLLATAEDALGVSAATVMAEIAEHRATTGWDGTNWDQMPTHPLVAEAFGLKYYDPDAVYNFFGNHWTFKQFILNYIRWADYAVKT